MSELVKVNDVTGMDVVEWVDQARNALQLARDNFERVRVRDQAKAVQEAAAVLDRRDIQVEASILVQEAERAVAKANPPVSSEEAGRRTGKKGVPPEDTLIKPSTLRNIRQAHVALADEEFEEMIEQAEEEEIPLTRKALTDVGKRKRREKVREERDKKLSAQETLFPTGQLYSVLFGDPPWRYDFAQTRNREIENQYNTMELEDIKVLEVGSLCHVDSVLYLWATAPKLPEALEVMEAWGFEYKTNYVWVKDKIGMGYWNRGQHEHLLIGTRGSFPPPVPESRVPSVISAARGKHSEKPVIVYELLEKLYPDMGKIELFARKRREGWTVMGNEIDQI